MEKPWLKSYPEGVPHDVAPEQFRSLNQLLEDSFKKNAAKPFSVCMDRWMSYGELDDLSAALGAWLQNLGLEPGARVAIMLPNVEKYEQVTAEELAEFEAAWQKSSSVQIGSRTYSSDLAPLAEDPPAR